MTAVTDAMTASSDGITAAGAAKTAGRDAAEAPATRVTEGESALIASAAAEASFPNAALALPLLISLS
jgi:hypothetical protein